MLKNAGATFTALTQWKTCMVARLNSTHLVKREFQINKV